ncbi:flagellar basal body protein [Ponticaulis sp.]|uniref:flagellar basal body rod protein FlgB n=1 Tax=Ponticaulis sp. TaxID=2020902 RepID=UPI0026129BEF|nr:flagellar basal body protein [Ponticaulis sp.]MDF1682106.1 flagellar basal body protein [Ponticaulis sp.]
MPSDLSVFQLLNNRLNMLETRQKTVAENVANANTPGYVPNDVDQAAFERSLSRYSQPSVGSVGLATTQNGHIQGTAAPGPLVRTLSTPDSEVTMDGNAVVVEEQMLRLNQTRADFDTALSLYQKGLSLIRLASRSPT